MPKIPKTEIAEHTAACLQLAILMEINAPKPGNVHPNADFQKTNYQQFLASTVAATPSFRTAATQGMRAAERKIHTQQIGIGKIIKNATQRINKWQHGGNTLLGTITLLTPIAAAAGKTLAENNNHLDLHKLRKNLNTITTATTPDDAVAFYEAIDTAKPGGLNKAPKFDATNPSSKQQLLQTHTTLYEVFKISSKRDSIAKEWTNNYTITFDTGLKTLQKELQTGNTINNTIIQTFLTILAKNPDTLIARKNGPKKAQEISNQAKRILKLGGMKTEEGRNATAAFDKSLRYPTNKLNPGTTADITATALALLILNGYRP